MDAGTVEKTNVPREPESSTGLKKDMAYLLIKDFLFRSESVQTIFSERYLAKELNIGLASVRAALERLRTEGIVLPIPKAGIRLPEITHREIIEFYEMRLVLEAHIVRQICGRLSATQCAELREIISAQKKAAEYRDTTTYHQLDLRFHEMLAAIHGNGEMINALSQMRDKMYRLSRRLHRTHPERLEVNALQHEAIAEAICGGDADAAEEAIRSHLSWGRDFTLDPDGRIR